MAGGRCTLLAIAPEAGAYVRSNPIEHIPGAGFLAVEIETAHRITGVLFTLVTLICLRLFCAKLT
jgi:hypothetical protein